MSESAQEGKSLEIEKIELYIYWSRTIGFIVGIVGIAIAFVPLTFCERCAYDEIGDWVGGVSGSLLSIAAIAFVNLTYLTQRKQIVIQQREISANEKASRTEHLHNWFFTLFQVHVNTVEAFDVRKRKTSEVLNTGRDCFKSYHKYFTYAAHKEFKAEVDRINRKEVVAGESRKKVNFNNDKIVEVFQSKVLARYPDLEVYFKSLGGLLRHLTKMEEKGGIEPTDYAEAIRSQLSSYELAFIHYYIQIPNEQLTPIMLANKKQIMRHGMLLHFRQQRLIKLDLLKFTSRRQKKRT